MTYLHFTTVVIVFTVLADIANTGANGNCGDNTNPHIRGHTKPSDDNRVGPGPKEGRMAESDNIQNDELGICTQTSSSESSVCTLEKHIDTNENELEFVEYPTLTKIKTNNVGETTGIEIESEKVHQRMTTILDPLVFEIPDFLSSTECNQLISHAKDRGLSTSQIFGADVEVDIKRKKELSEIHRLSQTAWLRREHIGDMLWLKLRKRLAKLTHLPLGAIKQSEAIQVVSYGEAGHFHAHVDSTDTYWLPCCFQTNCAEAELTSHWNKCCRQCRYITVMVYLNDVEEGGETAFTFANMEEGLVNKTIDEEKKNEWHNLSKNCHKAPVLITPEKGKAVMWYNHDIDDKGYLGKLLIKSFHGGCDVIKGSKWIANFWIGWPSYDSRFDGSIYSVEL